MVREIPAPTGLAPDRDRPRRRRAPGGRGRRLRVRHRPLHPAARSRLSRRRGEGAWRIVCFAQAPLEPDIGVDPLLADVAWSWLVDALDSRRAAYPFRIRHGDQDAVEGVRLARRRRRRRADRAARIVVARRRHRRPRRGMGRAGLHARGTAAGFGRDQRCWVRAGRRVADYDVIDDVAGLRRPRRCSPRVTVRSPSTSSARRASATRSARTSCRCSAAARACSCSIRRRSATSRALQAAIGDEEWVLHAASQDLPSLRELDLEPPSIFDTELAARLLGHERVGLGAVVEDTLGITLAKAHSASDWSTRPLPQSWLEYAALDVEHLVDVRDILVAELVEQGKTEFAAEEFRGGARRAAQARRARSPWRRLSGLHTVRGRTRARRRARAVDGARGVRPGAGCRARAASCPIARSSPRCSPTRSRSRSSPRVKEFTGRASRIAARPLVGGDRGRPCQRRICRSSARRAATRCRRRARGSIATPRRTRGSRPRGRSSRRTPRQLAMPTENLLTPELLRRVAWSPPDAGDRGIRRRGPRSTRCATLAD